MVSTVSRKPGTSSAELLREQNATLAMQRKKLQSIRSQADVERIVDRFVGTTVDMLWKVLLCVMWCDKHEKKLPERIDPKLAEHLRMVQSGKLLMDVLVRWGWSGPTLTHVIYQPVSVQAKMLTMTKGEMAAYYRDRTRDNEERAKRISSENGNVASVVALMGPRNGHGAAVAHPANGAPLVEKPFACSVAAGPVSFEERFRAAANKDRASMICELLLTIGLDARRDVLSYVARWCTDEGQALSPLPAAFRL